MRPSLATITVLAAFTPTGLAQGDFASSLLQALNGAGLSGLAGVAQKVASTTEGKTLFAALQNSNTTVFAPNNAAFGKVPSNVSSNADALAQILSYHVVQGSTSDAATSPNHTVARTFLNDSSLVQLEGGKSQVLVWTKNGSNVEILNQQGTVTVTNTTKFQNIMINVIDKVLSPPASAAEVLHSAGLTQLASVLQTAKFNPAPLKGYTFFAPNDDALKAAASTLQSLQGNMSALTTVLQNHIINGTTVYSTEVSPSAKEVSAAGSSISFTTNSTGTFVNSGSASAQIVRTDVLTSNGVIHVIDKVLANTESNPSAASSAFQSATSEAAKATTETGPIAAPSATSASGGNRNAASSLQNPNYLTITAVLGGAMMGALAL